MLFYTVAISYYFAKDAAADSANERVEDLGKATIRRIRILYNDIQTLAERVASYPQVNEMEHLRNENTIDVLKRLMNAVKASFDEIKQTANLPQVDDSDLYTLPETDLDFHKKEGLISNSIQCPKCKAIQRTTVASHTGASGHTTCKNCTNEFTVHRRADGNLFTGNNSLTKSSYSTKKFECSSCDTPGHFKYRPDSTVVHRSCLHCFQRFSYSPDDDCVTVGEIGRLELVWDGTTPIKIHCDECGTYMSSEKPFINKNDTPVMFCLKCGVSTVLSSKANPEELTHK